MFCSKQPLARLFNVIQKASLKGCHEKVQRKDLRSILKFQKRSFPWGWMFNCSVIVFHSKKRDGEPNGLGNLRQSAPTKEARSQKLLERCHMVTCKSKSATKKMLITMWHFNRGIYCIYCHNFGLLLGNKYFAIKYKGKGIQRPDLNLRIIFFLFDKPGHGTPSLTLWPGIRALPLWRLTKASSLWVEDEEIENTEKTKYVSFGSRSV